MALDETIIAQIRKKGFTRQAVLLESSSSDLYVMALLNPRWKGKIREAIGDQAYAKIRSNYRREQTEALNRTRLGRELGRVGLQWRLIGNELQELAKFEPRNYDEEPLVITIDRKFNIDTLRQAAKIWEDLGRLAAQANNAVYREVEALTAGKPDLLHQIFKDDPNYPQRPTQEAYRGRLTSNINYAKKKREEYLASSGYRERDIRFHQLQGTLTRTQTLVQEARYDKTLQYKNVQEVDANAADTIARAEDVLKDAGKFARNYSAWARNYKAKRRQDILELGRGAIEMHTEDEFSIGWEGGPLSYEGVIRLEQDFELRDLIDKWQTSGSQDHLELLLGFPLSARKNFIETVYEPEANRINSLVIGAQQLLAGGPITNPNATRVSILQNHNRFPNLKYSAAALQRLEEVISQIQPLIGQLPDISDLAAPHKILRKPELVYIMRELPKDPMDVTFGNDSGCCIFVPESLDKIQNGEFVPHYLTNLGIRLFGVYRRDGEKEQRMGLVAAFDTTRMENLNEKILTCNSLELSRMGLAGGIPTMGALSQYAEDWLAGYAQQHGYAGAAMGSHEYNTSVNHSTKRGNVVAEPLVMRDVTFPFYSDIFRWDKRKAMMITRDNSCYWLWRK